MFREKIKSKNVLQNFKKKLYFNILIYNFFFIMKNNKSLSWFFTLKSKGKSPQSGFTLVELIVVITILAILWTIAFVSLQWYSKSARDSARVSDMSRIKTSLELFKIDWAKYPEPTESVSITYNSTEAWTQWTFWQTTFNNVEKLDKIPRDPTTEELYIYSVTNTRKEFLLYWELEADDMAMSPGFPPNPPMPLS